MTTTDSIRIDNSLRVDGKLLCWDEGSQTHGYCWASPKDAVADLRDFLDMRHGLGRWTYVNDGPDGTDIVPAMHDACDAIRARYGSGTVRVAGSFLHRMSRPVDPAKLSGITIEGVGSPMFMPDFKFGDVFRWDGSGGHIGGGMSGCAILLAPGVGAFNGYGIHVEGDEFQPDGIRFTDITISALDDQSSWYAPVHINGAARTSPQGVRSCTMQNVQAFCAHGVGMYIANAVQWTIDNVGCFCAMGDEGGTLWISGGGAPGTNSIQLSINRFAADRLRVQNCSHVALQGRAGEVRASRTADYVSGTIEGATLIGSFGPHSDVRFL